MSGDRHPCRCTCPCRASADASQERCWLCTRGTHAGIDVGLFIATGIVRRVARRAA